jgi:hypothetical protein
MWVVAQGKSKDVILKWLAPLDDNGSAVTSYKIYRQPLLQLRRASASGERRGGEGWEGGEVGEGERRAEEGTHVEDKVAWECIQQVQVHLVAAVGPQATISQLVPGSQFLLRVTAVSEVGESPASDSVIVTTSPAPPPAPAPPTIFDAPDADATPASNCNGHGAGKRGMAVRVMWEEVSPHQLQGEVNYVLEMTDGTVVPPPHDTEWTRVFSGECAAVCCVLASPRVLAAFLWGVPGRQS